MRHLLCYTKSKRWTHRYQNKKIILQTRWTAKDEQRTKIFFVMLLFFLSSSLKDRMFNGFYWKKLCGVVVNAPNRNALKKENNKRPRAWHKEGIAIYILTYKDCMTNAKCKPVSLLLLVYCYIVSSTESLSWLDFVFPPLLPFFTFSLSSSYSAYIFRIYIRCCGFDSHLIRLKHLWIGILHCIDVFRHIYYYLSVYNAYILWRNSVHCTLISFMNRR